MPTIQDVARLAGVSPTTAKRALHEPEKLTPETLRRVQAAIAQLQYEPDQRAGALRGGQSNTIGLIVGSIVEPFFAEFARAAARELNKHGYSLMISENQYSAAQELEELRRMYGQRVAGIMLRAGYGAESRDYLARLSARGVSIVEFDYSPPHSPYPSVTLDNAQAIRSVVDYLAGLGHHRIAALGTYHPTIHPEDRSRVFPEAMNALGLPVLAEYQRVTLLTEDSAYQLTRELLSLPQPPTALIALTGTQAIGAYRALKESGVRLPNDLSLISFDNYSWTALVEPPVTVVAQPVDAMAEAAALLLIDLLEKRPIPTGLQKVFPGTLIVRGSASAPHETPSPAPHFKG